MAERTEKTVCEPALKREGRPASALKSDSQRSAASPAGKLASLHATVGNREVGRLFQTKLSVGGPNDVYELEADRIADTVMRMAEPAIRRKPT